MQVFLQVIINGLLIGIVWGILGLGKQIVLGVIHFVNFAHGHLVLLAMYLSFALWTMTGLDPYLLLPAVVIFMGALGYAADWTFVRPLVRRGLRSQMIATLALALLIEAGALMIAGPSPLSIRVWWSDTAFRLGGVFINYGRLMAAAIGIAVFLATWWFLKRTPVGLQIRAASQNGSSAQYLGINVKRVYGLAFALSVSLAGVVGGLLAVSTPVDPRGAWAFVVLMFVVPVLGGLGSIGGTMVAGIFVGLVQGLSSMYLGVVMQNVMVFVIFIVFLIVRPQGMFGSTQDHLSVKVS